MCFPFSISDCTPTDLTSLVILSVSILCIFDDDYFVRTCFSSTLYIKPRSRTSVSDVCARFRCCLGRSLGYPCIAFICLHRRCHWPPQCSQQRQSRLVSRRVSMSPNIDRSTPFTYPQRTSSKQATIAATNLLFSYFSQFCCWSRVYLLDNHLLLPLLTD